MQNIFDAHFSTILSRVFKEKTLESRTRQKGQFQIDCLANNHEKAHKGWHVRSFMNLKQYIYYNICRAGSNCIKLVKHLQLPAV